MAGGQAALVEEPRRGLDGQRAYPTDEPADEGGDREQRRDDAERYRLRHHRPDRRRRPRRPDVRNLLLQGADLLVLQDMEYNGIKFDKEKALKEAETLKEELEQLKTELSKLLGPINFNSGDQLSVALFGGAYEVERRHDEQLVYKSGPRKGQEYTRSVLDGVDVITCLGYFRPDPKNELAKTKGKPDHELVHNTRYYSTAADVLGQLPAKTNVQKVILTKLRRIAYIEKLVGTYLEAFPRLLEERNWGEYIHGQFNQVVARTGRLSSSGPNMQNAPGELDKYLVSRYV